MKIAITPQYMALRMNHIRATTKMYRNMSKEKNEKFPIYYRLIIDRIKVEFATKVWVTKDQWDDKTNSIVDKKKDQFLHKKIVEVESKVNQIIEHRIAKGLPVTAKIVKLIYDEKMALDSKDGSKDYLIEYFKNVIGIIEKNKTEYTRPTVNHYRTMQGHIEEYLSTLEKRDIFLSEVDSAFIQRFDDFLLSWVNPKLKHAMNRSSANKYHAKLRAVLHRAKREKLIPENPYDDFPLKQPKQVAVNLIDQEISRLIKLRLDNASLERVRDFLIFTLFSGGMRYSDVSKLKPSNLFQEEGFYFLLKEDQKKTNEAVYPPLLPPAIQILNKYKDEHEKSGFLLPRISHQKLNDYLKTLADLAGINKRVTHRIARHSFGTTICSRNSVPRHIISAWLGHILQARSTDVYAQVTKEEAMKYLKIIWEIYSAPEFQFPQ